MKTTLLVAFGIFLASLCSFSAEVAAPPGNIYLKNVEVLKVLDIYKALAGLELVTDSRVATVRHPITLITATIAKDKAVKLMEKALVEQAGVVITRLDDKRTSVTYNDALPISQATENRAINPHGAANGTQPLRPFLSHESPAAAPHRSP